MTLENLAGIGRLKPYKAAPEEISRLLTSAAASLADAKRKENNLNSRLDLAYKADPEGLTLARPDRAPIDTRLM